jgi:hypothetical protein
VVPGKEGVVRRRSLNDESGASSAIAFIIAGVLFLAAITLVLYITNNKVAAERPDRAIAGNAIGAESVLDLVLSPDSGWNGATAWVPSASISAPGYRPGLVFANGTLDSARIAAFQGLPILDVQKAFGLLRSDATHVNLTVHIDVEGPGMLYDLDFGPALPATASVALEPASLQVRIPTSAVTTAVVTVYIFPA